MARYLYLGPSTFITITENGVTTFQRCFPNHVVEIPTDAWATRGDDVTGILVPTNQDVTIARGDAVEGLGAPVLEPIPPQVIREGAPITITPVNTGGDVTTWKVTGLPTGTGFDPEQGVISGRVIGARSGLIRITAENTSGEDSVVFDYTVEAVIQPPSIMAINDVNLQAGNPTYSYTPVNTGGQSSVVWSQTGLPAGWTFNTTTGAFSGTPGSVAGTYNVVISATNVAIGGGSDSQSFTITVASEVVTAPTLPTVPPFNLTEGEAFNATLPSASGTTPITYTLTGLPSGLTFNPANRSVSGFVPAPSAATSAAYRASNSAGNSEQTVVFNITAATGGTDPVAPVLPTIADLSGTQGEAYSSTLPAVTAGDTPITYAVSGLPGGLSFNASTREITGTPAMTGGATITYTATNAEGTATRNIGITIAAPGGVVPVLPDLTAVTMTVGVAYTQTMPEVTAGTAPINYSMSALPAGLTFDTATRILSGTPTTEQSGNMNYRAANTAGNQQKPIAYTVAAAGSPNTAPILPVVPAIDGEVGVALSVILPAATSGTTPITYAATGLPSPLTFDPATRTVSGTPTSVLAATTFTYTATNSVSTATAQVNIAIAAAGAIEEPELFYLVDAYLPANGATVEIPVNETTGTTGITYTATGLPTGWSINASTGTMSGSRSAAGENLVAITATNSEGSSSRSFTLEYFAEVLTPLSSDSADFKGATALPTGWSTTGTFTSQAFGATGYSLAANNAEWTNRLDSPEIPYREGDRIRITYAYTGVVAVGMSPKTPTFGAFSKNDSTLYLSNNGGSISRGKNEYERNLGNPADTGILDICIKAGGAYLYLWNRASNGDLTLVTRRRLGLSGALRNGYKITSHVFNGTLRIEDISIINLSTLPAGVLYSRTLPAHTMGYNASSITYDSTEWAALPESTVQATLGVIGCSTGRLPGGDESNYFDVSRWGLIQNGSDILPVQPNFAGNPGNLPTWLAYRIDHTGTPAQVKAYTDAAGWNQTVWVVNVHTSTPAKEIGGVQAMITAGHNIVAIEFGNENYIDKLLNTGDAEHDIGHATAEDYAVDMVENWIPAFKTAFPNIPTFVAGASEENQVNERWIKFTSTLVKHGAFNKSGGCAGISLHPYFYVTGDIGLDKDSVGDNAAASQSAIDVIQELQDIMGAAKMGEIPHNARIIITEHGGLEDQSQGNGTIVWGQSAIHGLTMAQAYMYYMSDSRVDMALVHSLTGNAQWEGMVNGTGSAIDPTKRGVDDIPITSGLAKPFNPTPMGAILGLLVSTFDAGGAGELIVNSPGVMAWKVAQGGNTSICCVNTNAAAHSLTLPTGGTYDHKTWTVNPWATYNDLSGFPDSTLVEDVAGATAISIPGLSITVASTGVLPADPAPTVTETEEISELSYTFTNNAGLPSDWKLNADVAVVPGATAVKIDNIGGTNNWGVRFVESPVVDLTKPIEIVYLHGGGNNFVGIHNNILSWTSQSPDERGLGYETNQGRAKYGRQNLTPQVTAPVLNDQVKLSYAASGDDLVMTVTITPTNGDPEVVNTYTQADLVTELATPNIVIDAAYSDVNLVSVKYTPKEAPKPPTEYDDLADDTKILIAASGQSNWRGHPLATAYAGTMPTKTQVWNNTTKAWQLYTPNHHGYVTPMTPTLGMVLAFEERYPDLVLYVVEDGKGGANITEFITGATGTDLIDQITNARNNLAAAGEYKTAGFLWWQGENDAQGAATASAYAANLTTLLGNVDTALGLDAHKLLTQIHTGIPYTQANIDTVRAALTAAADTLIDVDDYDLLADDLHFSPADYQAIGASYLDALEAIAPLEGAPKDTLDIDFTGLTALPSGWVADEVTTTFGASGMTVTSTIDPGTAQWRNAHLTGPAIEWDRDLVVYFKGLDSQAALGVTQAAADWLTAGNHTLASIWSAFYQGSVNIKTFAASMVVANDHKITFSKSGDDIVITTESDTGGGFAQLETHTVTGGFAGVDGAKFFIDPKTKPVIIQRIVN